MKLTKYLFLYSLALFALLELGFRFYNTLDSHSVVVHEPKLYEYHPELMFTGVANTTIKASRKYLGHKIFDNVAYKLNELGFRELKNVSSSKSISVFGSSVIFGKGLTNEKTTASHISRLLPDYSVTDYSMRAWGTQHILGLLNNNMIPEANKNSTAIIFVSFNEGVGHVERFFGDLRMCRPCEWVGNMPMYKSQGGGYMFSGPFKSYHSLKSTIYRSLQGGFIYYLLSKAIRTSDNDYRRFLDFLDYLSTKLVTDLHFEKVYLVNHPISDASLSEKFEDGLSESAKSFEYVNMRSYIPHTLDDYIYYDEQVKFSKESLNIKVARKLVDLIKNSSTQSESD